MKKFKLFRFGKCYINREGDFVIALLKGSKKHGYTFAGSNANPSVWLGKFYLLSRIIPNDGSWIEVDEALFNIASAFHVSGYITQLSPEKLPAAIIKKY